MKPIVRAQKVRRMLADAYPELLPIANSETDYKLPDKTRVRLAYLNTQEEGFPDYITEDPPYDRLLLVIDNNGDRLRMNMPRADVEKFIRLLT